jgi:hypothetical protein
MAASPEKRTEMCPSYGLSARTLTGGRGGRAVMPEDGKSAVHLNRTRVVHVQRATVAQFYIRLPHHLSSPRAGIILHTRNFWRRRLYWDITVER